jgi:hypothetical protein
MASVPIERFRITKGEERLTLYQWNTGQAKHYFCRTCGIYTHHQRRTNARELGVNIACLEGVDPFAFEPVAVADGASRSLVSQEKSGACSTGAERLEQPHTLQPTAPKPRGG